MIYHTLTPTLELIISLIKNLLFHPSGSFCLRDSYQEVNKADSVIYGREDWLN